MGEQYLIFQAIPFNLINHSLQKNTTAVASDTILEHQHDMKHPTGHSQGFGWYPATIMSAYSNTLNKGVIDSFSGKALQVKIKLTEQPYHSKYEKLQRGIAVIMDIYESFFKNLIKRIIFLVNLYITLCVVFITLPKN